MAEVILMNKIKAPMRKTLQEEEFLPYMPGVTKCERALRELNFTWRLIESTAKMVCPLEAKTILPTMKATRDGFISLESQLITNLVQENITKTVQEMYFKAHVIIDIVVRNLFERTADVGFLAMDDAIREFILDKDRKATSIVPRLRAYCDKYTVYDEILILDTTGKVLAHLDSSNDVTHSSDPLLAKTLGSDAYVETFHHSDLRPAQERSLIYSRKIMHPQTGQAIGVLCLCFPLEVEMKDVFAGLRKESDRSIMLMLDRDGCVIASNDANHIAPGRRVPLALAGEYEVVSYAGREYFAKTCAAQDYQGYGGPGWLGHVMIPCETAFRQRNLDLLSSCDAAILTGIMAHAKSFCPPLHDVSMQAESINSALRRVVWNGKIMSAGEDSNLLKLKSILQEISQTGDETSRVFKDSIHDLYETVISSSLQDVQFISRLMIDIMDRNLYERANDCRWWALTPDIRHLMSRPLTDDGRQRITQILESINALYTAYCRLVVFDRAGPLSPHPIFIRTGWRRSDARWTRRWCMARCACPTVRRIVCRALRLRGCMAIARPIFTARRFIIPKMTGAPWAASGSCSMPNRNSGTCCCRPCPSGRAHLPPSPIAREMSSPARIPIIRPAAACVRQPR